MHVPDKVMRLEAGQAEEVTGATAEQTRRVTCAWDRLDRPDVKDGTQHG